MKTLENRIKALIRPEIRELSAYHVPDPGEMIKLDAMENPYGWPDEIKEAWWARMRKAALNRYPDPAARNLRRQLAGTMGLAEDMDILLGNGSDELIQVLALALAEPGAVILAPEPGFVMYRMIARFAGMKYVGVPLRADFSLDREAMLKAIHQHKPRLVFIAYPNNPTGNLFARDDIKAIIEQSNALVVVDEAYHAFAGDSFIDELGHYDNLLVMRTLSKLGLAGLRLGFLMGHPAWLQELDKIRLPYNINVLTQISAEFALAQPGLFDEQVRRLTEARAWLFAELEAMQGVVPFPSRANFILFKVPTGRGDAVFNGLKAAGVLIKNLNGVGGLLADCLRVTVGTPEENRAFLRALAPLL